MRLGKRAEIQTKDRTPLLACAFVAMGLFVVGGVIAIGFSVFLAAANPDVTQSNTRLRTSARGRFSIQVPDGMFFTQAPWTGIEKQPDYESIVAIANTVYGFGRFGVAVEFRRSTGAMNSLDDVA